MSDLRPIEYKARRYHAGSSDAEPISIVVFDDEFQFTDSAGAKISVPMHDVTLKLGGSSNDRVVLEIPQSGDTVIVKDLDFLKVLKKVQATSVITRQVNRAQNARTINKLQGLVFFGVVLGSILLFGGCLFVAIILEPDRESKEQKTTDSAPAPKDDSVQAPRPKADELKLEADYQQLVKSILLRAWKPPKGEHSSVVTEIRMAKDGRVIGTKVTGSSNHKKTDASAIAAVQACSPLPAPPPHWNEPIVLNFTFNPWEKPKH